MDTLHERLSRVTPAVVPVVFGIFAFSQSIEHAHGGEPLMGLLLSVFPLLSIGVGFVFAGRFVHRSSLSTRMVWKFDAWLIAGALVGGAIASLFLVYQDTHGGTLIHANYIVVNSVAGGAAIASLLGYTTLMRTVKARELATTTDILDAVRELNRQIATIDDRETLEQAVCETLAAADPYVFAWIGTVEENEIVPTASAGVDDGYLDSITITVSGGDTSEGPTGTAARTHESAVMQNVQEDTSFGPWRDAASERGYQSSIAVPLAVQGTLYGVLSIYADRPDAFGGRERAVLEEVGVTLANSIAASETRHRESKLLNSMDDVVLVYAVDTGRILDANQTTFDRLGVEATALVGRRLDSFVEAVEADDWFRENAPTEQSVFESSFCTDDGETVPVEVSAVPIRYEGERAMLALARDITTRRKQFRSLRTYMEAIEHAGHAIYITDADGVVEYVNPAFEEQTGYDGSDIIGETPAVLNSGHYSDEFYTELWETIAGGDKWHYEGMIDLRKDGTEFYIDQTIAPIVIDDEVVQYVAIHRDITALKENEKRLEERNEQLELLNQIVRHDIRNDMQIVLGMSQLLEERVDDEDCRDMLDSITEKSDHVVELTQTVGELMTALLGDEPDGSSAISVKNFLEAEVEALAHGYPDADVRIEGEIPSTRVCANEMLESVFRNVLNNAVQHNRSDDPEVVVQVDEDEDHLVVHIEDNGPGIPEIQRSEVFGKGERGLESSGTGLGLYLVQSLVEHYGGNVDVRPNDPTGSIFEIRLRKGPCSTEEAV
ncbi:MULTISPECIES: PAS domain S-box protein [Haloferax]|uniref:histidine kinase n=1 Tax=Haloferax marinum TaxID=2666143 RepID=A0A6A8G3R8_9EURY|nr:MULTISPECIES: PAS domain S-box protein [Haloferax]KAB1196576.1 PAS domain S-box protein [Haloferax sp. CBA1150]MRW95579.1 PAS domain S-box protein [Haloferax marinum]